MICEYSSIVRAYYSMCFHVRRSACVVQYIAPAYDCSNLQDMLIYDSEQQERVMASFIIALGGCFCRLDWQLPHVLIFAAGRMTANYNRCIIGV